MLHSAPSFSVFNTVAGSDDEGENRQEDKGLNRTATIGDSIEAMNGGEFSFGKRSMELIEEEQKEDEEALNGIQSLALGEEVERPASPPLYLATGLGIHSNSPGGIDLSPSNFDESGDVEGHYRRMVDENPSHPLILKNYAQLLQSKGDFHGAEEYYLRATLADPEESDILLKYAKLVGEQHRGQERALRYFERAAKVSPQDSNVLAAYAGFLWGIEDDAEADNTISDVDEGDNVVDYYRRMLKENPHNPSVLKNFAVFLSQSKGDLLGAKEYYLRAVEAAPEDGETMSRYASLPWELHHDDDKALRYFERAVQATPDDSNVLAAYARFLWETEGDKEDSRSHDQLQ